MSRAYNAYIESAVRVHGALSEPQEKWLDPPDPERDEHRRLVANCTHRYDERAVCMLCGEPDRGFTAQRPGVEK